MADLGDGAARTRVAQRIEELNAASEQCKARIAELESLTNSHALSDIEFDLLRQMLSTFRDSIDAMGLEQKRAAIRALVRKVVWDGTNVHVVLFGADEGAVDLPENIIPLAEGEDGNVDGCTEMIEDEDNGNGDDGEMEAWDSDSRSETPWGEDSK